MQFRGGWFKSYLPPDYANWAIAYVCGGGGGDDAEGGEWQH